MHSGWTSCDANPVDMLRVWERRWERWGRRGDGGGGEGIGAKVRGGGWGWGVVTSNGFDFEQKIKKIV